MTSKTKEMDKRYDLTKGGTLFYHVRHFAISNIGIFVIHISKALLLLPFVNRELRCKLDSLQRNFLKLGF